MSEKDTQENNWPSLAPKLNKIWALGLNTNDTEVDFSA